MLLDCSLNTVVRNLSVLIVLSALKTKLVLLLNLVLSISCQHRPKEKYWNHNLPISFEWQRLWSVFIF